MQPTGDADEKTTLLAGKTRVDNLEARMVRRIKIFRDAYTMNQATYVTLAVLSLAMTSTVAVIQVVPKEHRIIVAALGAGATVITGFMTYSNLEVEMNQQEDALLKTQGLLEKLRLFKYSDNTKNESPEDQKKREKIVGQIGTDFVDVRFKTSTPNWIVNKESDTDPCTRDDHYDIDLYCCKGTYIYHAQGARGHGHCDDCACCFCFTMKKRPNDTENPPENNPERPLI